MSRIRVIKSGNYYRPEILINDRWKCWWFEERPVSYGRQEDAIKYARKMLREYKRENQQEPIAIVWEGSKKETRGK
jgi:hypothetical protein